MNIEDEYILSEFKINFLGNSQRSMRDIVIYGTGDHTQILLENISGFTIKGLMDYKRTGEWLWGYKVLSYEEVSRLKDPIIVILARNAVIHVIYSRIEKFCQSHSIDVYDINGKKFGTKKKCIEEQLCFMQNKKEVISCIEDINTVMIGVFNTLITRCVLRPRDIFQIIDKKLKEKSWIFSEERIRAEGECDKNVSLDMIYDRMGENLGLSDEQKDRLMELEIDTECQYLIKRQSVCDLLAYAKAKEKNVILVSDMYMPKRYLVRMLDSMGITEYDDLFVSCEYKCSKEEGLFECVLDKWKLDPKRCLHIGDSLYADILAAQRVGIRTFRIYSTSEMLESGAYSFLLEKVHSVECNVILADFAGRIYNDPFGGYDRTGRAIFDSDEKLCECLVAPIIFKYITWLIQGVAKTKSELVIFPSRDGYLLQKIYDDFRDEHTTYELPESLYLYTSRRAALVATAKTAADIYWILDVPDTRKLSDVISARFGVEAVGVDSLKDISSDLMTKMLQEAEKERNAYRNYLNGQLKDYKNVAFVDFVAAGTIQSELQRLVNCNLNGWYVVRRESEDKDRKDMRCESLYPVLNDYSADSNVYRYYYFLENIMTSYEPSFLKMSDNGEKLFYEEKRTQTQLELLQKCHEHIEKYCLDMFDRCDDVMDWNEGVELYDAILGIFSREWSAIEDSELLKFSNIDEFMGKKVEEVNR